MRQLAHTLALAVVVSAAHLAAAQTDQDNRHISPSSAAIGIVIAAAIFLLVLCCGIQRRRRVLTKPPYASAGLPLTSGGFPHGIQYSGSPYRPPPGSPLPMPGRSPYALSSEYPPASATSFAPPPYVKDAAPETQYAPPPGPPPGFEAPYSPGPPPRAHVATHSGDFSGGFRPPMSPVS
ncbi:hypothetical protein GGX14DRAFT_699321 [Mycena pura]|uniref:Uncharacterized protein n=1 Tax=Mycena pura TaxID=153505 RepID=A0AAD6Y6J5_9AGAR|nr:hypothetical protein GGX14DRAFT_699321 [Mycena pura]